ncbi:MAG: sigma-70 family RNA polymerase sigma factor [Acidobacteriota bacterium]|nr:sigma-70 family RNA polymerase sigma factor [Acidobacteriota bacterium]
MEEKELVRLSQSGQAEAFSALVRKYHPKVFSMAFNLTRNREAADDLAQEIFIKAYVALPKFRLKSEFGTWLYRIAFNHIRDHFRKEGKYKQVPFDQVSELSLVRADGAGERNAAKDLEAKKDLVHRVLRSLPEKHQAIVNLRDIQGFSYEEISRILKISPGTVDSRLHRARKMLRKKLAPYWSREGGLHAL